MHIISNQESWKPEERAIRGCVSVLKDEMHKSEMWCGRKIYWQVLETAEDQAWITSFRQSPNLLRWPSECLERQGQKQTINNSCKYCFHCHMIYLFSISGNSTSVKSEVLLNCSFGTKEWEMDPLFAWFLWIFNLY